MQSSKSPTRQLNRRTVIAVLTWSLLATVLVLIENAHHRAALPTSGETAAESLRDTELVATMWLAGIGWIAASYVILRRHEIARQGTLAELRANETRLRTFYDETPVAYQSLDPQGRIVEVNNAWCVLLGYARAAVVGRQIDDFVDPSFRSHQAENLARLIRDGEIHGAVMRLRHAHGHPVYVSTDARVSRDAHGSFVRTHCVLHDITARLEAEAAKEQQLAAEKAVLENALRWQVALEAAGDGLWDWNIETNEVFYSDTWKTMLGYAPAEISNRFEEWETRVHPDDLAATLTEVRRHVAGETHYYHTEHRVRCRDNSYKWVLDRGRVVSRAPDGRPLRMIGTQKDLTEARRAADVLRASERHYRLLFDNNPLPMWVYDRETLAFLAVNDAAVAHYGYSRGEFLAMTIMDIRPSEDVPRLQAVLPRLGTRSSQSGEWRHRKKDGTLIVVEIASHAVQFDDRPARLVLAQDITVRKQSEERLREQAALLELTQDAIFVLTLDRVITYVNRGAEQMYGLRAAEAKGRRYDETVYQKVPQNYQADWQRLLGVGSLIVERAQITAQGKEITVQKRATLVRDAVGRPQGVLVVITDITEAKRLEQQFLRAQRMESLGALASGVAHDLNNVLTPILVATDMLRPLARETHDVEIVQLLGDSARRGAEIVQQLLLFGRGSDTPRTTVEVGAVVRGLHQMMQETFPKNIALSAQVPTDLWPVEADRTQLHQLLLNLTVNARDAMPRGGRLEITTTNTRVDDAFAGRHVGAKPGPHVAVCVKDTGTGIAREHLDKVFDPFFTTKPMGQGTGLGLSTALGIARSHGGFISLETQEGRGTRFTVFIPAQASRAVAMASSARGRDATGHGELVLLVDDEMAVRRSLENALKKAAYRVVTASNGAEAVSLFAQHARDVRLVITDMMMPVMDGAQLIQALRRRDERLPIIAMSGLRESRPEWEKASGARLRFLPKPFLVGALLEAARELIDGREPAPPLPA